MIFRSLFEKFYVKSCFISLENDTSVNHEQRLLFKWVCNKIVSRHRHIYETMVTGYDMSGRDGRMVYDEKSNYLM